MIHIGPHVSSQGSVSFAPLRANELGATGFALFTKNQRQWRSPELKEEDISAFKKNIVDLGYCSDFDITSVDVESDEEYIEDEEDEDDLYDDEDEE